MIGQKKLPGLIATLVEVFASMLFLVMLHYTKFVPNKFLIVIGVGLLLVNVAVYVLTMNFERKGLFVGGLILILLTVCVYIMSGVYVMKGVSTLAGITNSDTEQSTMAVYVRTDDPAKKLKDAKGYTFGILASLDRETTDAAIKEIEKEIGEIEIREYRGITELVDGMVSTQETNAIVFNEAFLNVLEDMEGYGSIPQEIREIFKTRVQTVIAKKPDPPKKEQDPSKIFTVLISGIDSRSGIVEKSRSDVNILATVNTETHQVLLVSTPRDYFVPLSISEGAPDKLTHAGIYGIGVCMDTLEMLYQTEIDYYFRLNFSGFENIINSLGGITVNSDCAFDTGTCSFVQGENQVDGAQALAFARERYAFEDGDRQRGRNQMAVIEGVIRKALSPALLSNYSQVMESLSGSFETNVPYDVVAGLVRKQLEQNAPWEITSMSVDGTGTNAVPYSMSAEAYVMIPNMDTVKDAGIKMEQLKEGTFRP